MRVMVTGGAGFIGSNLVRFLISKHADWEILTVDKLGVGSSLASLKDLDEKRHRFVRGDLSDFKFVNEVVRDVDAILHLAAESHVDRSISNPSPFVYSNTVGTFNLLEAVRRRGENTKIIHVSTDEVYGEKNTGSSSEEDPLKPSSMYAASKAAADLFCEAYHRTYGLKIIITRSTNNFGPYQFPEKLIPKTIIRALMNLQIPIYGSGENIRDWIYVQDHCEALDLILQRGKCGEIYNISTGEEHENLEVVKKVLHILNKPGELITFVEDRPGHDSRYSLNSSKLRNELGWSPKYNFDEALEITVRWYQENKWWWGPLVSEEVIHPTPWKIKW
ncbi:MAG: dTDP-glucose 4,6-dehydratase [Candidatus Hadarchaeales archaeon]